MSLRGQIYVDITLLDLCRSSSCYRKAPGMEALAERVRVDDVGVDSAGRDSAARGGASSSELGGGVRSDTESGCYGPYYDYYGGRDTTREKRDAV